MQLSVRTRDVGWAGLRRAMRLLASVCRGMRRSPILSVCIVTSWGSYLDASKVARVLGTKSLGTIVDTGDAVWVYLPALEGC